MTDKENKICMRIVIKLLCRLDSPLLIGSGEDEQTDSDQLVTADGIPFIPGSATAGAMRSCLEKRIGRHEAEDLFGTLGWIQQTGEERKASEAAPDYQSRIFIYDTLLKDSRIIHRDGVRLNERKNSNDKMKFDMEAVETGSSCCIRLEIWIREKNAEDGMEAALNRDLERVGHIVSGMESGALRLGARGNRGFGKIKVLAGIYRVFRMDSFRDLQQWLNWNWGDETALSEEIMKGWNELKAISDTKEHCLRIPLRIKTTLLIRNYGTHWWSKGEDVDTKEGISADYEQLTLGDGTAVIPGSTWAGAVRSYIAGLVREIGGFETWEQAQKALDPFWGTWSPDENHEQEKLRASKIIIDETKIVGGHRLPVRRTSVDRFTGGAAMGALFEEVLWAGGDAELTIRWSERELSKSDSEALTGMLLWAVQGLKDGLLAVGGETGVGRGIFELTDAVYLDGQPVQNVKPYLLAAAFWCGNTHAWRNG